MGSLGIGLDLLIALVAAIIGGMLARWLRLPVMLGYLAAGVAIGPHGLGVVTEQAAINSVANIGVVLLLFTIGLGFSLRDLKDVGRIAVLGGLCQMLITALVVVGISRLFGFPVIAAIFFGIVIAESSTAVILRLCTERGELDSRHGRIASSLSIIQDLSCVPVIAVMPAVGSSSSGTAMLMPVLVSLGKGAGFIAVMLGLGWWVLPVVFGRLTKVRSRELFLLFVVVLCLATAIIAGYLGLSAAFGAFVAGLLISQSAFARQAFADIVPLRDIFSAMFFVSLGMYFNFGFVLASWKDLLVLLPILVVVKIVIAGLVVWFFGASFKTSLLSALALLPVGEFSFIMARVGFEEGIFTEYHHSLIIAVALLTMLVSPFILNLGSWLYLRISQSKLMFRFLRQQVAPFYPSEKLALSRHAVICGYGTVGRRIAEVLDRLKFPYLVIELEPNAIAELRRRGIPCIYGDASNPEILAHAGLDKARVLLCTMPDYLATELTVRHARRINPKLDILARVHRDSDVELLKGLGVSEIVLPFFEGSLEMIRHTLHRFGLTSTEIQYILNSLRQSQLEKKG